MVTEGWGTLLVWHWRDSMGMTDELGIGRLLNMGWTAKRTLAAAATILDEVDWKPKGRAIW